MTKVRKNAIGIDKIGIDQMELRGVGIDKMELTPFLTHTHTHTHFNRDTSVPHSSKDKGSPNTELLTHQKFHDVYSVIYNDLSIWF